jgi:uncharacterized protein
MLTFRGVGYTPDFAVNMAEVLAKIAVGAPILLVDGPDDLCRALKPRSAEGAHCATRRASKRDEAALRSLAGDLPQGAAQGRPFTLSAGLLAALRADFAKGRNRAACSGCEWSGFCGDIARSGFAGTVLRMPPSGDN